MCGLITQIFGRFIVLAGFELNKAHIVKELCVQKEKPKNCCQGSCHLKKELEKQDDSNSNSQNQQKIKLEQEQTIQSQYEFKPIIHLLSIYSFKPKSVPLIGYHHSVFHPPCKIASV